MEVHAHTHSERKKWTHYIWEFLMLFLAVFCGFMAENLRENHVERIREHQYMESMVRDLERDTALLNFGFPRKEERIKAIDTIFQFFELNPGSAVIPAKIYSKMRRTSWDRLYERNTGTINQLKNAGGLRLIRNPEVADSIIAYDLVWTKSDLFKQGYVSNQQLCLGYLEKIFIPYEYLKYYLNPADTAAHEIQMTPVKIHTEHLEEYLNFLFRLQNWTRQDLENYQEIEQMAEGLIKTIKQAYHLK